MRPAWMIGIAGAALAASLAGCATSPYTYNDRDEPIDRSAGGQYQYRGTVVRVDEPQRVVVLDNGQMYRVSGQQAVLVNGQPVVLGNVRPGTPVTIVSGTPVVYQNGQYVAVPVGTLPPTTTTVQTPPVQNPPATVVTAPTTVVTAPTGNVVRMYGRVTDIDRDGTVKVRMADGRSFEFRAPAGTVLRKGDTVAMDMTFGAVAPSALPR